jgi:hypothetical protein
MIDTEQSVPDLNEIAEKVNRSKDDQLSKYWEKYWYDYFEKQIAGAKMTIDGLLNQRDQLLSAMTFKVELEPLKIVLEREKFDKLVDQYAVTNQTVDLNKNSFEHPLSFVYGDKATDVIQNIDKWLMDDLDEIVKTN